VDFQKNSFRVETTVEDNASVDRSTRFAVSVKGPIRGDSFVVERGETTLFSFTRFEAEKPGFFSKEFPFIAYEARKNPNVSAGGSDAGQGLIDMLIGVSVAGGNATVRIRKQAGAARIEVKDPSTNVTLISLPLSSLNSLSGLIQSVSNYLSSHPSVIAPDSAAPKEALG